MKKQILALLLAFVLLLTSALVSCGNESVDIPETNDDKVTDGAEENEKTNEEKQEEEDETPAQPIEGERRDYYKNPEALYAQLSKKEIAFTTRVTTDVSSPYDENIVPEELVFIDSAQMLRDRVERICCAMYLLDGEAPGVPGALTEEWQKFVAIVLQQDGYADLDDAFFAEKVLIPFYEGGGLIRVERVVKQGDELVIIVQYGRRLPPGVGSTADVYLYQYLVAVDKKDIEGIEKIKMFVVPLNDARMPKEDK